MSVDVTYRCNGCEAEATVTGIRARRRVISERAVVLNGIAYDKTIVETPTIETAAPDGWMVFDPYTQMTYCPACWEQIESGEPAQTGAAAG